MIRASAVMVLGFFFKVVTKKFKLYNEVITWIFVTTANRVVKESKIVVIAKLKRV